MQSNYRIIPLEVEGIILSCLGTYTQTYDQKHVTEELKKPALKLVREHITHNNPSILKEEFYYIGSAIDIETPLYLGFKNITMFDPGFDDVRIVGLCADNFSRYIEPGTLFRNGGELMSGTLRGTQERVRFRFVPKVFMDKKLAEAQDFKLYIPTDEDRIGMAFSYCINGNDWFTADEMWRSMVTNGYFFSNQTPDVFHRGKNTVETLRKNLPEFLMPFLREKWGLGRNVISFNDARFDGLMVQKLAIPLN